MQRVRVAIAVLLVTAVAAAVAAKPVVHLDETFAVAVRPTQLVINGAFERILDQDLWYKLESGVRKPIFVAVYLVDDSRNVVAGEGYRVDVWYDGLAETPCFVITMPGSEPLRVSERQQLVPHVAHLRDFSLGLPPSLPPGSYRIRVEVKLNPWTQAQLAELNRIHQPLRHINVFKTSLFDNSRFRPQREFVITSQPFVVGSAVR